MTDMKTFAIAMHEMLISLIDAGFTRIEAIELVKVQIVASMQK